MTMILTCLTKDFIVQASDRRLTYRQGRKTLFKEDDRNKALIYDNHTVFAYTGLATLSNQKFAIDWAAELLATPVLALGHPFTNSSFASTRFPFSFALPLWNRGNYLENWAQIFPPEVEQVWICFENEAKTRHIYLDRKAHTRAGNRKNRDDSDTIIVLRRTCLTHSRLNTLISVYADLR